MSNGAEFLRNLINKIEQSKPGILSEEQIAQLHEATGDDVNMALGKLVKLRDALAGHDIRVGNHSAEEVVTDAVDTLQNFLLHLIGMQHASSGVINPSKVEGAAD